MILAISSAATGPTRIRRLRNMLPSLAPNCSPSRVVSMSSACRATNTVNDGVGKCPRLPDRKSTRLNSSHANISYAVFCLKKTDDSETQPVHWKSIVQNNEQLREDLVKALEISRADVDAYWLAPIQEDWIQFFFFLRVRRPRISPLFPSPTLSR